MGSIQSRFQVHMCSSHICFDRAAYTFHYDSKGNTVLSRWLGLCYSLERFQSNGVALQNILKVSYIKTHKKNLLTRIEERTFYYLQKLVWSLLHKLVAFDSGFGIGRNFTAPGIKQYNMI